eukprot:CAMPEP_0184739924 /NCGR_PEP_ID=MMETSP0315-20130426/2861_1 /TAXON_ID=101924 /ORGANISM="Rhodosorus marinus, Strain UTEX LB 2760" /LENGTH=32 /DNA_ID= /DNA_START= /DNA_END= /DNA_ORIENTATION=
MAGLLSQREPVRQSRTPAPRLGGRFSQDLALV